MKVGIKDLGIVLEVKKKGIELDVYDKGKHRGDLVITNTKLIWCKGRTGRDNGTPWTWEQFIDRIEGKK